MQDAGLVDRGERAADLTRVVERSSLGIERRVQALGETARAEILHRDVGVIVGDAEVEDAHDIRVLDARDDLVLLEKTIERARRRRNPGRAVAP